MSERYIPSLSRITEASKSLPSPDRCHEETYQVKVSEFHSITFRKAKFKVSGGSEVRWIYEGKIRFGSLTGAKS